MATWKRITDDLTSKKGSFAGKFLISLKILHELTLEEILFILRDIKAFVREKNSICSIQTYEDENGRRLFLEDKSLESADSSQRTCLMRFNFEV